MGRRTARCTQLGSLPENIIRGPKEDPRSLSWAAHTELGHIANVEPVHSKINAILVRWATKAVRTGDPLIKRKLESPSKGFPLWHD